MGFVYLIRSDADFAPQYKIGYTKNNSKHRLKQHETGNPNELSLIAEFETKYNQKLESVLHRRYKQYHIKGEWFNLPLDEVHKFLSICQKTEDNLDIVTNNIFL